MDEHRRLQLQLRIVTAVYAHERRRGTPETQRALRARCLQILDAIADSVARYPDLLAALVAVRQELEREELLAANRLSQQPVNRVGEAVD